MRNTENCCNPNCCNFVERNTLVDAYRNVYSDSVEIKSYRTDVILERNALPRLAWGAGLLWTGGSSCCRPARGTAPGTSSACKLQSLGGNFLCWLVFYLLECKDLPGSKTALDRVAKKRSCASWEAQPAPSAVFRSKTSVVRTPRGQIPSPNPVRVLGRVSRWGSTSGLCGCFGTQLWSRWARAECVEPRRFKRVK